MITWLSDDDSTAFPPVANALATPNGLLAAGGSLSVDHIVAAYERGIFPWYSAGQPVLWWSPDPRAVLFPDELHLSRSLRKTLRSGRFETRFDTDFPAVIRACSEPRGPDGGTWLVPEMIDAYARLHAAGYAHSIETWRAGELVGGLYGVCLGRVFFGESMFSRESDASKVALARLVEEARARGIGLIDCQMASSHLESMGSRAIPRKQFLDSVERLCHPHAPGLWTISKDGQI